MVIYRYSKEKEEQKMKNLFEKYEVFKGGLKWEKLTPKEYEKAVKEWMNQNEGRKKKKK